MFDALQLEVVYQSTESAVYVAVTLYDRGDDAGDVAAQVRAEDWMAPPVGSQADGEPRRRISMVASDSSSGPDQPGRAPVMRLGPAITVHIREARALGAPRRREVSGRQLSRRGGGGRVSSYNAGQGPQRTEGVTVESRR
jgi:hypothetical protein